jgi:predicted nucleic acid-binding protein
MTMRVYVDTSVIGGCLDEEFAEKSRALIELARQGGLVLLVSDLLLEELSHAPHAVRRVLARLPAESIETLTASEESRRLRDAYLAAGVVGIASESDAHHVALATIARADLVLSWNFRHVVHVDKIKMFNAVNLMQGYGLIDIRSPLEVV